MKKKQQIEPITSLEDLSDIKIKVVQPKLNLKEEREHRKIIRERLSVIKEISKKANFDKKYKEYAELYFKHNPLF